MENFEKDYKITGTYASLLSFIGWLILLGGIASLGIYIYITFMGSGAYPLFLVEIGIDFILPGEFLLGGVASIAIGLLVVITGQILRAIVDNTNANKETLSVLKSIKNSALLTNTQKEIKGNYVRDGIEFKTKEDLEDYFETMKKNS
jgi:hypothetical protein|tara:strand:- start:144 stop:584 length:441 start_codon:yes stop_codon:yes gene_type:complete